MHILTIPYGHTARTCTKWGNTKQFGSGGTPYWTYQQTLRFLTDCEGPTSCTRRSVRARTQYSRKEIKKILIDPDRGLGEGKSIVVYYDVIPKRAISDDQRDCPSPEMLSITPTQEIFNRHKRGSSSKVLCYQLSNKGYSVWMTRNPQEQYRLCRSVRVMRQSPAPALPGSAG